MSPMDWLARLWSDIRKGWLAYVAVGVLLALMAGLAIRGDNFVRAEGKATTATIVSISSLPAGRTYPPRGVRLIAQTESGLVGSTHVPRDRVTGCAVGDAVFASEVDGSLRLDPWPC
jgi:hypothetical protein